MTPPPLLLCLVAWVALSAAILWTTWRRPSTGLVLAYVLSLWILHGVGAAAYTMDWAQLHDPRYVHAGFALSTLGLAGFALGAALAPRLVRPSSTRQATVVAPHRRGRLARRYLVLGSLCYFVLVPLLGRVPSLTAVISAGLNLVIAGLGLRCMVAWTKGTQAQFLQSLLVVLLLPVVTIVGQGFLGYGTIAAVSCFTFVSSFYKPRWRVLAAGLLLGYVGLSFYVSYIRDREAIRRSVWGGEHFVSRVELVAETVISMELFDPTHESHLMRIDRRLNQNHLVGAAMRYMEAGRREFARGETIWLAVIAVIPRAIWPEKPVHAGSQGFVSRHTGMVFAENTSVGMGQVFELYINFSSYGVFFGFLLLGGTLALVDSFAAARLIDGQWGAFAVWYVPGLSLLQAGGALAEMTASVAGAVILVYAANRLCLGSGPRRATPWRLRASRPPHQPRATQEQPPRPNPEEPDPSAPST